VAHLAHQGGAQTASKRGTRRSIIMSNLVILTGHIGADFTLNKTNTAGKSVCNFSMATNRKYNDSQGNKVEKTDWLDLTYRLLAALKPVVRTPAQGITPPMVSRSLTPPELRFRPSATPPRSLHVRWSSWIRSLRRLPILRLLLLLLRP